MSFVSWRWLDFQTSSFTFLNPSLTKIKPLLQPRPHEPRTTALLSCQASRSVFHLLLRPCINESLSIPLSLFLYQVQPSVHFLLQETLQSFLSQMSYQGAPGFLIFRLIQPYGMYLFISLCQKSPGWQCLQLVHHGIHIIHCGKISTKQIIFAKKERDEPKQRGRVKQNLAGNQCKARQENQNTWEGQVT